MEIFDRLLGRWTVGLSGYSVSNASEKGIHPHDSFRCPLERCSNNLLDDALVPFQEQRPDIVKVGLADAYCLDPKLESDAFPIDVVGNV